MLAIVDSGGANIMSVSFALERLGVQAVFTADPAIIRSAERVILPGVGSAGRAMHSLHERNLVACLRQLTQPVLGICLGMQLLYEASEEGNVVGLGVIPGHVRRLPDMPGIRIPHMGWNTLEKCGDSRLLSGIGDEDYLYFVHSYAAPVNAWCLAESRHGMSLAAAVEKANFVGVQFHPERSGAAGLRILKNFLEL